MNTKAIDLLLGQILSAGISFLAIIFLARYCGPSVFGYCTISILILSVYLDLIDFGGASWSARELAASRISTNQYIQIARSSFKILIFSIIFAPLWLLITPPAGEIVLILLFYPALWNRTNYLQQFLIVNNEISSAIKLQIGERIIWLICIPMIYFELNEFATFVVPIILGLIFHAGLGTLRFNRLVKEKNQNKINRISIYKKSIYIGWTSVLSDVSNLDTFVVAKFVSIAEAGSYALVTRIKNPLNMIFQSIATKQRPIFARRIRKDSRQTIWEDVKLSIFGIALNLIVAVAMLGFADQIYGAEYLNIGLIMFLGILSQIPTGINILLISFLAAVGEEKFVSKIYAISTPMTLATIAWVGFQKGIIWVCWSVLFINFLSLFIYFKKSYSIYIKL